MRNLTLAMFACLMAFTSLSAQTSCSDLNGYVNSRNTAGTGAYTLNSGQEEKAAQTYHYAGPGLVNSVRVYGNYPNPGGVPLRVSICDVDANGRPTTQLASSNATWWWYDNGAGYITVYFPHGGVYVTHDFAVSVELRNASPWGTSFQLQYTGNGEGHGEDLASLAGTSTGFNWASAMSSFSKDGDFYLVPRMTHFITPAFSASSSCIATNAPVNFSNQSLMTRDSMFNTIGLSAYTGNSNYYTWDFGDGSPLSHVANPVHSYTAAGAYTVTLTCAIDGWNNDCSASTSQVISVGLGLSATSVAVTCNGNSNGSITLSGSGGATPYMYHLNAQAPQSGNLFNNLPAGTYTAFITDDAGCAASTSVTITQPSAIVISNIASTNSSCGNADGALLVTASGGTGTLQYQLNSSAYQLSNQFTNLLSDFYTITVKDANGCTTTNFAPVNDQGAPVLTVVSQTNVSCNMGNNGTIVLSATGGSGVLQYSINGGLNWQISGSFSGLTAGTYPVMVKDGTGCSAGLRLVISQPSAISFETSTTPVSCFGGSNGSVTVSSVIGGTGNVTYSLNNQSYQSGNVFNGLTAGSYTVYVRDVAGCISTQSVTVASPSAIIASAQVTNAGCNGEYSGSAIILASGGTSPYFFSINSEYFQEYNTFNELQAGSYNVIVRDENGCQVQVPFTVTEPTVVSASVTTGSSTCGNSNGTLLVAGSGGSGSGYQYSIDGTTFNSGGSFSGLTAGTYNIIVKDGNGCQSVFVAAITDANGPVITSASHTNVACHAGTDGTITVNTVTGGTGVLQYSVNGSQWQTSTSFPGLGAGTYTVLVKDANGCVGETSVTLTEPSPIVVSTVSSNISCNGDNTGGVVVNAAGGSGTLAYAIDEVYGYQSSNAFNNMYSGLYLAVVRDAAGCYGNATFTITEPTAIGISYGVLNVMCNGDHSGAIYVNAGGGTGALQYSLNGVNYQSASTFTALGAGVYVIYVKDANGCVHTTPAVITQPAPLAVTPVISNVVCSGGNDGMVDLTVSGGVFPYGFMWSNLSETEDVFNLASGSYSVTITDANGCFNTQSFTITQPANPLVVNGNITNATLPTAQDGSVDITVNGGDGPYTYLWSNGATTEDISNVAPGVYTVSIMDANGCSTSGTYTVSFAIGILSPASGAGFALYPNPANESFTIDAGTVTIVKIELVDMLGQVVYSAEPAAAKVQINTEAYSEGAYFVRLYTTSGTVTKRIHIVK